MPPLALFLFRVARCWGREDHSFSKLFFSPEEVKKEKKKKVEKILKIENLFSDLWTSVEAVGEV